VAYAKVTYLLYSSFASRIEVSMQAGLGSSEAMMSSCTCSVSQCCGCWESEADRERERKGMWVFIEGISILKHH
jgi:hypothetical protein